MPFKLNGRSPVFSSGGILALAALCALGLGSPATAETSIHDEAASAPGVYRVGKTGIHCYQEPCPWRGIIPVDAEGKPARWPIWSGNEPPALQGEEADRQQIAAAWANDECLTVEGRFADATLQIRRIVGPC